MSDEARALVFGGAILAVGVPMFSGDLFPFVWGAFGGVIVGLAFVAKRDTQPVTPTGDAGPDRAGVAVIDPAASRLLAMGFRLTEIEKPLAKARAEGNPDPVAYVLGSLIR